MSKERWMKPFPAGATVVSFVFIVMTITKEKTGEPYSGPVRFLLGVFGTDLSKVRPACRASHISG
jgi:hypothetical protein